MSPSLWRYLFEHVGKPRVSGDEPIGADPQASEDEVSPASAGMSL